MNTTKNLNITKSPPFKKILKSIPFWAVVIAQVGNYMGYYTVMTGTPLYLSSILHTSIQEVGRSVSTEKSQSPNLLISLGVCT